jgi:hypothetical protein
MRDIYATQFALTTDAAFEAARGMIAAWCLDRYPTAERLPLDQDRQSSLNSTDDVSWSSVEGDDGGARAWTMIFRHADREDPTLRWRILAQLVEFDAGVRFTYRMSQESIEGRVRPAIEVPGRPRIVRDLARNVGGTADGRALDGRVGDVHSDSVRGLVNFLRSPSRRLPVVALTLGSASGRPATDAEYLADQLIALAHVVLVSPVTATFELTDQLATRNLAVFDGAVRIYWPGLGNDADGYLHRLWLPSAVDLIDRRGAADGRVNGFARHLLTLIGDVAALRIPPDPVARDLRRQAEARQSAAERAEWNRLIAEQAIPDIFAEEFDRQTHRIEELELELAIADEDRARLEGDLARMARNMGMVRAAVAAERGDDDAVALAPTSITEALDRLAADHPDSVVVLDQAFESARETRYRHVDRAGEAMRAIGVVAQGWHDDTLGTSFDNAFAERGFDLRATSPVTQGRHQNEYSRTYKGHRIMVGPHLALGDGGSTDTIFRAYWYLDEETRQFVVGHVGRHLDDSTT